jgi:spore coat protein CotF
MGHEALLGLMIQKGWANPYDEPTQQLQSVISQAQQSSSSQ